MHFTVRISMFCLFLFVSVRIHDFQATQTMRVLQKQIPKQGMTFQRILFQISRIFSRQKIMKTLIMLSISNA